MLPYIGKSIIKKEQSDLIIILLTILQAWENVYEIFHRFSHSLVQSSNETIIILEDTKIHFLVGERIFFCPMSTLVCMI